MKLQLKKCGPILKMGKKDRYPLHRKGKANNENAKWTLLTSDNPNIMSHACIFGK